jgi:hypothetical protein
VEIGKRFAGLLPGGLPDARCITKRAIQKGQPAD